MSLSEKTGQKQKIEVGVWPLPFYHRKTTWIVWKDYQRRYFQKLGMIFYYKIKPFLKSGPSTDTNLMNSRTPIITHFIEHSTRLPECKIKWWIAFTNWWPKMIFFLFISHILTIICFPAGIWTTTSSRRSRQEYFQISLPWGRCK